MEAPGQKVPSQSMAGAASLHRYTGGAAMGMGQCPGVPSRWEIGARVLRTTTALWPPCLPVAVTRLRAGVASLRWALCEALGSVPAGLPALRPCAPGSLCHHRGGKVGSQTGFGKWLLLPPYKQLGGRAEPEQCQELGEVEGWSKGELFGAPDHGPQHGTPQEELSSFRVGLEMQLIKKVIA